MRVKPPMGLTAAGADFCPDLAGRLFCGVEARGRVRGVAKRRRLANLATRKERQGSSAVEQGTHKPLVGSSILPSGKSLICRSLQLLSWPTENWSENESSVVQVRP